MDFKELLIASAVLNLVSKQSKRQDQLDDAVDRAIDRANRGNGG